ncbi:MAG: hypothetical protein U0R52_11630 [Solirubrobacterales bacterium]
MADVDKLFAEYVAEHRAGGEASPRTYLRRLEGTDRDELAALIDGYLVRSPGRDWDPAGFEGSTEQQLAAGIERAFGGRSGMWPVLLPRLRERARIKRAELVRRLAEALGVGSQQEKVAAYYHQMEQGQLESKGVATRVLEALAGIVGSSAEALRSAGEPFGEGSAPSEGTVFARLAAPLSEELGRPATSEGTLRASRAPAPDAGPDEVDRLFTGGD